MHCMDVVHPASHPSLHGYLDSSHLEAVMNTAARIGIQICFSLHFLLC